MSGEVSGGAGGQYCSSAPRLYGWLLRLYPRGFRTEYGAEVLGVIGELRSKPGYRGPIGSIRLWLRTGPDLIRGGLRERAQSARERWVRARASTTPGGAEHSPGRSGKRRSSRDRPREPYGWALLAGMGIWLLYVATLAPTTAFWDAGEYMTAAHTLGLPHPPGNPLFVLVAHGWERMLAPLGLSVAVRLNLLAATVGAVAHVFWFLVAYRLLAATVRDAFVRRLGALAATVLSATAFTVWTQSNVTEKVYGLSLLTVALLSWMLLRWRDAGRPSAWLVAAAFVVGLSATNHLMGVLVAPAAIVFVTVVDRRIVLRWQLWLSAGLACAAALSLYLFLPLRAEQRPILAEADPRCDSVAAGLGSIYTWGARGCTALSKSLTREQYDKPPITVDPTVWPVERPRDGALVAAQLLNYAQYFDWQWARSVAGGRPLLGGVRPLVSLFVLLLGLLGARAIWRSDHASGAYVATLFLTFSFGLVVYLNFKYGYAIGYDRVPDPAMHEVRERDYFFLVGFSVWGVLAGCGLATLAERLRERTASVRRAAAPQWLAVASVFGLALVPLSLNWSWASRTDDWTARDWAYNVLMSVEPYSVLFTNGDNDTFPLWYLQEVEGLRRDVTVMVTSYLNSTWYPRQLRDLTKPCTAGLTSGHAPTRIVCQRPYRTADIPAVLLEAGMPRSVAPPADSAVPLSDEQIERLAAGYVVTSKPLEFRAGPIRTKIAAGTPLLPADTFVAAIVQATIGQRPIHFMPASSVIEKLGLTPYTVRSGLTLRLNEGPVRQKAGAQLQQIADPDEARLFGAWVDLARTDTLIDDVFRTRGRLLDPAAPWADAPSATILLQYSYMHLAAAWAHDARGQVADATRHLERAEWWHDRALP